MQPRYPGRICARAFTNKLKKMKKKMKTKMKTKKKYLCDAQREAQRPWEQPPTLRLKSQLHAIHVAHTTSIPRAPAVAVDVALAVAMAAASVDQREQLVRTVAGPG